MRLLPRRLFGRLVLGLAVVSTCAVGVAAFYLYTRFHDTHSLFYESTLQGFIGEILKDLRSDEGRVTAAIAPATLEHIARHGGRFVVLDADGRVVTASKGVDGAFVPFRDARPRYFWLPEGGGRAEFFGLSAQAPGLTPPAYVQLVFPSGHIVFESVLHEFMKDIAWIWLPFLLVILLTNVVVVRIALAPLSQTVEEARAIQPGGVAVSLTEAGLPEDLLALVRTVNEAFGRLREAYRSQEEFVADMAHELRTPIAVMKAQLAMIDAPHARQIETDVSAMARLVEQLLDRARLGRFRIEPGQRVDLREAAREAAGFLAAHIVARGRLIEVEAPDRPVMVAGGRDDIFRATRNLIENALEHSPEGGMISVTVTGEPAITVRDRGRGYPPAILDAAARRKTPIRSERRDGVGLGLSIVERTVEAHGGALRLSNPPDGGASATMQFPAPPL